ncbi:1-deoxy-D-xylulose-5-phosphate synthase [bacterium CG2_30_54_10]|nr:MAG: 1-deoxy-D-xylulose-5-phosphate synthase [bacterium CG2_30_54_10]
MLLEKIHAPADLRILSRRELIQLSQEIRERIIQVVSRNGGHLASNLGIVELTLAIHRVFDSPRDRIIFDVGHQCYVHKIVTGRNEQFPSIRTLGGISGFPKADESPHDAFDTGHSSTSISAALGLALARDHFNLGNKVVAVIGDGAMTGGMAFEALNHAGQKRSELIVILNDNEMSISPNVGAMSHYLHKLRLEPSFFTPKEYLEFVVKQIPGIGSRLFNLLLRLEGTLKYLLTPGMLFEEFGFKYLGPISGYDFELMERTLTYARDRKGPVLIHVLTEKGRGYRPAKEHLPLFHGVGPFEITTGKIKIKNEPPSYTSVFGQAILELGRRDSRVVAVTAAMKEGTGLNAFAAEFPNRFFDVGIAEPHAVALAAGMAKGGLRPVVAIYSTFLQRAYDQIIHDVALTKLPVVFCLDRAGLVGEDGPTHHGVFDIAFLRAVPNMVVMAPKNEEELREMVFFAGTLDRPVAIRFPRGAGVGVSTDATRYSFAVGRGEICLDGNDLSIWGLGSMLYPALKAAQDLAFHGIRAQVVNPRFVKPLDRTLLERTLKRNMPIVTIEEGVLAGGFGAALLEMANEMGYTPKVLRIGLPDSFIPQGKPAELRAIFGLDPDSIASRIREWIPEQRAIRRVAF